MNAAKKTNQQEETNQPDNQQQNKSQRNNYAELRGNLGSDPRTFGENNVGASFRMATHYTSEKNEKFVEWHNVTVFGDLVNTVLEKCKKGTFVKVQGRIHYSENKSEDRTYQNTEIIAWKVTLLGRNKETQ